MSKESDQQVLVDNTDGTEDVDVFAIIERVTRSVERTRRNLAGIGSSSRRAQ